MDDLDLFVQVASKLICSSLCGVIFGAERERRHNGTGLKTFIMISVGTTLFTISSKMIDGDQGKVLSQIISGIGFLGAGAIFKPGNRVIGMTTASVIWVVASLGILCGLGHGILAVTLSILGVITLLSISKVEKKIFKKDPNQPPST